jgi:hypothetical protein
MFNFKRPPMADRNTVLSEYNMNYMFAKPDIFMHTIDGKDDMLILANDTFYSYFQPVNTVTFHILSLNLLFRQ